MKRTKSADNRPPIGPVTMVVSGRELRTLRLALYEAPSIQHVSYDDLLAELGPAIAFYGGTTGSGGSSSDQTSATAPMEGFTHIRD